MNTIKNIIQSTFLIIALWGMLTANQITSAQVTIDDSLRPNNVPTVSGGTFNTDSINKYLFYFIGALVIISGSLAVFFVHWGGFTFIMSRGNEDSLQKAKKIITWAILGLLLIIVSYQITTLIIQLVFMVDVPPEPTP